MVYIYTIQAAADRLRPILAPTPLLHPAEFIWLKAENRQQTGSFKVRGALNKMMALDAASLENGVVAASAGNHGIGVAFAAKRRGVSATVVVPQDAVPAKVKRIQELGAQVVFAEGGYADAEAAGLRLAAKRRAAWISPYNDPDVISGQGTLGLELVDQLAGEECPQIPWRVYVPVSGGGLICGVGLALKARLGAKVRLIGVQPAYSPYMHHFFYGLDMASIREQPTLADGLAGAVESGSITFDLLSHAVDEIRLVSEKEIRGALEWAYIRAGELVEPSAAAALAAALPHPSGEPAVVVMSGGNLRQELALELQELGKQAGNGIHNR
jgi:threonine dehydratase